MLIVTNRFAISAVRVCVAIVLTLVTAAGAWGQTNVTSPASFASTVQPNGPSAVPGGMTTTAIFNIVGVGDPSNPAPFRSFGVLDFTTFTPANQPGVVTSLSLRLTENNAGFTQSGTLNFYVTTDTATSTAAGASPLAYQDPPAAAPPGVGTQLSQGNNTLYSLGAKTYTPSATGNPDTFTFAVTNPQAQAYLTQRVNSGDPIRVVINRSGRRIDADCRRDLFRFDWHV